MNRPLVWLHGDSLSPEDPAVKAYPGCPRVFVFDAPWLKERQLSFKRLFFLYECALEAADEVRVGSVVDELVQAVADHGCDGVVVTKSDAPRFDETISLLQTRVQVERVDAESWISIPDEFPLRRFTAFWKKLGTEWS
jgi:hypothetical protein